MFNFIDLSDPQTLSYIKTIGYPTMFVIMILEGPAMTMLGAFLASLGFFNIFIVFFLSVLGDILGDIIFYLTGYYGGSGILKKAERFLRIDPETIAKLQKLFLNHGRKTIFYVKSTTGLCWITFIAAGAFKMKFKDFLFSSFWGGIFWSTLLSVIGVSFGYAFEKINVYIKYAGILIFTSAVIFYISLILYKKYQSKKILKSSINNGF